MGKRTYEEDIAAMALLYRYQCCGSTMLSYDKIEMFDKIINDNLDRMNSSCGIGIRFSEESDLCFRGVDENGISFAVIKPNVDIERARSYHIGCLPADVVIASQMPNALEVLGLKLENGKFKSISLNTNAKLDKIIERIIENPRKFYEKIAEELLVDERAYLKKLIDDKSCKNCSNMSCRVDHTINDDFSSCLAWDNKEMIGKMKILSNNRI